MAPSRQPSRSSSPATSTISSRSTTSTSRSIVSSLSLSSTSSSSSSSSSKPITVTLPAHSKTHLVLIAGLPAQNNTKQAVYSIISRFLPKLPITQLVQIPEGIVVQSPVAIKQQLVNTIGAAQFGSGVTITSKIPTSSLTMASVVVRGVDVSLTENQIREELLGQKLQIHRVTRIKNDKGPTFMVRVSSSHQETLQYLLNAGAFIMKKRHRVEPSYELAAAAIGNI